jgi:hypothetical protein
MPYTEKETGLKEEGFKVFDEIGLKYVILFDGNPLVILENVPFGALPSKILDWYAKEYAISRSELGYSLCTIIPGPKDKDVF